MLEGLCDMNVIQIITIDKIEFEATDVNINQKIKVAVTVSEIDGDTEIRYSGDLYSDEI